MARAWLSVRVDLVEGHGEPCRPRPGRIFAAVRSHTFRQVADAIDDAFARWDRSHLQEFTLTGTVGAQRIDPVEALGILPGRPLPYWGWATFPTSTAASGTVTTATHPSPPTPGSLIFHRSGLTGGPPADGRGPGSRHCSRAPAHSGPHRQAVPPPRYTYAWSRGMVTIRGGPSVFLRQGFRVLGWLPSHG